MRCPSRVSRRDYQASARDEGGPTVYLPLLSASRQLLIAQPLPALDYGGAALDTATPAGPWFTWLLALGLAEEAWPWLAGLAVAPFAGWLAWFAWRAAARRHRKGRWRGGTLAAIALLAGLALAGCEAPNTLGMNGHAVHKVETEAMTTRADWCGAPCFKFIWRW